MIIKEAKEYNLDFYIKIKALKSETKREVEFIDIILKQCQQMDRLYAIIEANKTRY